MDTFYQVIQHPFTWGLLLGLLITAFIWKSGFTARRNVARELKRVDGEMKNLQMKAVISRPSRRPQVNGCWMTW